MATTKTATKKSTKSTNTVSSLKAELDQLREEVQQLRAQLAAQPATQPAPQPQRAVSTQASNVKYDKAAEVTAKLHRLAKGIHGEGPLVRWGLGDTAELEKLL